MNARPSPEGSRPGARSADRSAASPARSATVSQDVLRQALLATVDMLHRRRASDIPTGYIDAYVDLHWLQWHGGGLKLTITGQNVCDQLSRGMPG
jgi:hypothetical protein